MLTNLFREKTKWLIATFFAVLSAISLIESQVGLDVTWKLGAANFFASVGITLVSFLLIVAGTWRFERFMRLSKGDAITLVISAYKDKRPYDPAPLEESHNLRYFKIRNGQEVGLVGAHGYLTGLETAKVIATFVYQFREIVSDRIDVVADDDRIHNSGPVICFGSPNSNLMSEKLLPSALCEFQGSDRLLCPILGNTECKATTREDFGVLARLNYTDNRNRPGWAFVCAGIDEEGTVAASHYLLNRWNRLRKYDGPFLHLIQCDKEAPHKPKKVAGFHLADDGSWKAD